MSVRLGALVSAVLVAATCSDRGSQPQSSAPPTGPPKVAFSSYLGGSANEMIRDVATDADGNLYLAGSTRSADFPTTAGVLGPRFQPGTRRSDGFVTKVAPDGTLLWSTFLGGPNYERVYGIEIDPGGAVVVAGRGGAGLPVSANVFQPDFAGGTTETGSYGEQDGFICKLAPTGQALAWCSYFGVADGGILRDVAVDAEGNIYVVGVTDLGGFPSAWFAGTVQPAKAPQTDIIVAKIAGDGSRVLWATYLGGSGDDGGGPSIRVDPAGNPIVMFDTGSPDLVTVNAFDPSFNGRKDLFVVKLSPDGRSRLFATYLGGSGMELTETHGLWVDRAGNVIAASMTGSADFPTTPGAYQQRYAGGTEDGFAAKLSPEGKLLAATYLGTPGSDTVEGVATDSAGQVFLSLTTDGPFPVTGYWGDRGGRNAVAVSLSSDLSAVRWALGIGGAGNEAARASVTDGAGNFIMAGQSNSANWPTLRPFQAASRGELEGIVVRLAP